MQRVAQKSDSQNTLYIILTHSFKKLIVMWYVKFLGTSVFNVFCQPKKAYSLDRDTKNSPTHINILTLNSQTMYSMDAKCVVPYLVLRRGTRQVSTA